MKVRVFGLLVSGCATLSSSKLVDEVRVCERATCASTLVQEPLELSCGGSGEVIKTVRFASIGLPTNPGCPENNTNVDALAELGMETRSGCHLAKSMALIEAECLEKETCLVDLQKLFELGDEGLESCNITTKGQLEYQVVVSCSEGFDALAILTSGVIAFIGLALGSSVKVSEFRIIYNKHKRALIVGWLSQFGFMPIVAFVFSKFMEFDPRVAVGLMIVGASPGGTTSNLMTYWAKGNVALSMVMSAASTLCAIFMLPLLTFVYINEALNLDGNIVVPFANIFIALSIAIIPAALGVYIRHRNEGLAKKVEIGGSSIGALFILAALVIGLLENPDLRNPQKYPNAWIAAAFLQQIGCLFGYVVARLFRLPHPEARAVCLETGVQNTTLAIAIVTLSYTGCERLVVLTMPILATFWYLINSIWITLFLRFVMARLDTPEEVDDLEEEEKELHMTN